MKTIYAWLITKDHAPDASRPEGTNANAKGVAGPHGVGLTNEQILNHPEAVPFRLKDDDDELLYEGVYVGPDDESLFAPKDDFGEPNAGATNIEYRCPNGTGKPGKSGPWTVI